jgi:hypothetical protein
VRRQLYSLAPEREPYAFEVLSASHLIIESKELAWFLKNFLIQALSYGCTHEEHHPNGIADLCLIGN